MVGKRAAWQTELERAKAKLAEAEPKIPREVRTTYDKTVKSMGHEGFAEVSGRSCGGCQGDITMGDRYKLEGDQFLMCSCGRILYLPETKPAREEDE
jgi:predicted  nucleic acid-binding Zn-ribbon protein